MVLVYVNNDDLRTAANARAIAERTWPGQAVAMRNPMRLDRSQAVETAGVVGVVLAGGDEQLRKQYLRRGIKVVCAARSIDRRHRHAPSPSPQASPLDRLRLAEEVASFPSAKLCALLSAQHDIPLALLVQEIESERSEPREDVLHCTQACYLEIAGNGE